MAGRRRNGPRQLDADAPAATPPERPWAWQVLTLQLGRSGTAGLALERSGELRGALPAGPPRTGSRPRVFAIAGSDRSPQLVDRPQALSVGVGRGQLAGTGAVKEAHIEDPCGGETVVDPAGTAARRPHSAGGLDRWRRMVASFRPARIGSICSTVKLISRIVRFWSFVLGPADGSRLGQLSLAERPPPATAALSRPPRSGVAVQSVRHQHCLHVIEELPHGAERRRSIISGDRLVVLNTSGMCHLVPSSRALGTRARRSSHPPPCRQ